VHFKHPAVASLFRALRFFHEPRCLAGRTSFWTSSSKVSNRHPNDEGFDCRLEDSEYFLSKNRLENASSFISFHQSHHSTYHMLRFLSHTHNTPFSHASFLLVPQTWTHGKTLSWDDDLAWPTQGLRDCMHLQLGLSIFGVFRGGPEIRSARTLWAVQIRDTLGFFELACIGCLSRLGLLYFAFKLN